jgi:Na+/H+-translocating membrane pyrophosphatase
MILGASMSREAGFSLELKTSFMIFPIAVHCLDIFSSTVGMFYVCTKKGVPEYNIDYGNKILS